MAWVTAEEVLLRWVDLEDKPHEDNPTLAVIIEDFEDEILRLFPKIQQRIDSGAISETTIKRVVASATIRAWKVANNPFSQFSESAGPFSSSASLNPSQNRVTFTPDELALLSPKVSKVKTVSMAPNASARGSNKVRTARSGWGEKWLA